MMPFVLTNHAVSRFRERFVPDMTQHDAKRQLAALAPSAVLLDEKSLLGQDMWQIDPPGVILVCKYDPTVGIVAVTSLTSAMRGPTKEELEELRCAAVRNMAGRKAMWSAPIKTPRVKAPPSQGEIDRRAALARANEEQQAIKSAAIKAEKAEQRLAKAALNEEKRGLAKQLQLHIDMAREREAMAKRKNEAHRLVMERNANEIKSALRMILRAAEPFVGVDPGITEAWDTIAHGNSGLLLPGFLGAKDGGR